VPGAGVIVVGVVDVVGGVVVGVVVGGGVVVGVFN
jgi:hypothetical protein